MLARGTAAGEDFGGGESGGWVLAMRNNVILATISDEAQNRVRCITIGRYKRMLISDPPDKGAIAEMIYHRFYGRYVKPFQFGEERYKRFYKHGFAMMASALWRCSSQVKPVRGDQERYYSHFIIVGIDPAANSADRG
jgi:hypothetical protein